MIPAQMNESVLTCNQKGCNNPSVFRFTWPGRDEAGICAEHAPVLKAVAEAIGLHLQMITIMSPREDDT